MDFIEQDAASHNSVDDIRELRENVVLSPMSGGRKVYLLDEVHMLSKGAYNALLKTLEEPPPHIIFVLATTEAHKVESTIISRCQRFDLKRIPHEAAVDRLAFIAEAEGLTIDRQSLEEIARASTGSLRDGVNALEQVVTYYGSAPTYEQVQEALGLSVDQRSGELARLALAGDLPGGLRLLVAVRDDGVDMKQFGRQVVRYLRGLLLSKAGAAETLDLPAELAEQVRQDASTVSRGEIVRALRCFSSVDFRDDPQSSVPLELAFIDFVGDGDAPARKTHEGSVVPASEAVRASPVGSAPRQTMPAAKAASPAAAEASATPSPEHDERAAAEERVVERASRPSSSNGSRDLLENVRLALKESHEPGDKQLSALLNGSCEVRETTESEVALGFYHTFHLERVESGGYKSRLGEAFSESLGRKVTVRFEHSPRERSQEPAKPGHLVQAAKELGARPIGELQTDEGGQVGE
jgi:DNA polymerase-3 subunit gamma/tau